MRQSYSTSQLHKEFFILSSPESPQVQRQLQIEFLERSLGRSSHHFTVVKPKSAAAAISGQDGAVPLAKGHALGGGQRCGSAAQVVPGSHGNVRVLAFFL